MRYLFLSGLLLFSVALFSQKPKTILFVGAHPDDESAIGDALVKYGRLGYKVIVMVATDGKGGTRVTKIPEGDSLGGLRKLETTCACKKMGIEPPVFLSVERLDTKIGVGNYFRAHKRLMDTMRTLIPLIRPDVILTFGPDGDTRHAEHIVVGSSVTALLLAEGWVEKYPLYYVSWTKEQGQLMDLAYVNDQYMNVKVEYTDADELKALEAYKCYVTQFTAEELKEDHEKKTKDPNNYIHFRRFVVQKGMKNDLFQK